ALPHEGEARVSEVDADLVVPARDEVDLEHRGRREPLERAVARGRRLPVRRDAREGSLLEDREAERPLGRMDAALRDRPVGLLDPAVAESGLAPVARLPVAAEH